MKKEDTITAAHLIQAAKLGNSKADNIVRTGKKYRPKTEIFVRILASGKYCYCCSIIFVCVCYKTVPKIGLILLLITF